MRIQRNWKRDLWFFFLAAPWPFSFRTDHSWPRESIFISSTIVMIGATIYVESTRTWARWFLTNPIYRAPPSRFFGCRGTLVACLLQKQNRTLAKAFRNFNSTSSVVTGRVFVCIMHSLFKFNSVGLCLALGVHHSFISFVMYFWFVTAFAFASESARVLCGPPKVPFLRRAAHMWFLGWHLCLIWRVLGTYSPQQWGIFGIPPSI